MKNIKTVLFLLLFFMASSTAFAQYYYPHNAGVDRRIDRQKYAPKTKNKKAKEKKDIVELTIEQLHKRLNLDDFQKAAIANIYKERKEEILSIPEMDIPYEAKQQKAKEIAENIDAQIMKLLSKEQAGKYQEIINDRKY